MRNYRIAFFTVDWNYELVEATLRGIRRFVDDHRNVRLCVFDCFGKETDSAVDRSEYAIYNLPDLKQFDGILIQGSQIVRQASREAMARKVAESGVPAVTLDCPIPGCTLVSVDNERAQYDITAHVIRDHGARRLVYLTGLLDNNCPEAPQRRAGFENACRDNGITGADMMVIPCTWRTSDGIQVAERWLQSGKPLPDAFVCANDEMALGTIETLTEHGLRVPEDVIVTGFDNVTSAELSSPRLSTIYRDYAKLDYHAMEVLLDKIDGVDVGDVVPYGYSVICSESCGCKDVDRAGAIRNKYFQQTRFLKNFYTLQDDMASELFEASTLQELMDIVEHNHGIFGCDSVFLCINGYYYDNYEKALWKQDSETFDQEMVLAACGSDKPGLAESLRLARFPTEKLLPGSLMARERFLVFYPLHYNTYSIGYLVMNDISESAKLNLHKSIFSFLEIAIENVRKKCLLRQLNDVLDDLYVHDALTNLYNRFGFDRFAHQTFDSFMKRDGGVRILFVDMDDMKGINDRFGHEIGDEAIRNAANILRRVCDPADFLMRYGGDEFLVVASCRETDLEEAIQSATEEVNRTLPYRLGLSVGTINVAPDDHRSLDACVQAADTLMYERKKRRKALR